MKSGAADTPVVVPALNHICGQGRLALEEERRTMSREEVRASVSFYLSHGAEPHGAARPVDTRRTGF